MLRHVPNMYGLRVADVGHGACSLFLSGGGEQPAMIIDCGSRRSPDVAVAGLERILDLSRRPSLSIVVTHLHEDHYNGLLGLSRVLGRRPVFGDVDLMQARLPIHPITPEFVARFVVLADYLGESSGIPDVDLRLRLAQDCAGSLRGQALSRGDKFQMAGHTFDVLWPPAELSPELSVLVHRAVAAFDALAEQEPALRFALERARRPDLEMDQRFDGRDDFPMLGIGDEDTEWVDDSDRQAATLHGTAEDADLPRSYPAKLEPAVRAAANALGSAANHLSLVFATEGREFVSWGDAPRALASRIAASDLRRAHSRYGTGIALAPHHGSHGPTPTFGSPFVCVGQNGGRLLDLWKRGHAACDSVVCVSTGEVGDIGFSPRSFSV